MSFYKSILIFILSVNFSKDTSAQNFQWAQTGIGRGQSFSNQVVQDSHGYLYACGTMSDTLTFGNIICDTGGLFIIKYDTQGNLIWLKVAKSSGTTGSITIDNNDKIYIATFVSDSISQFGNYNFSVPGILIAQLDTSGNINWAKMQGKGWNLRITNDATGNILLTGGFLNTISFDSLSLSGYGAGNMFLAKIDSSGNTLWLKKAGAVFGNPYGLIPLGMTTDISDNILISGWVRDTVTFDSLTLIIPPVNGRDAFIVKYDPSGNLLWVRTGFGSGNESGTCVATDSNNNVYLGGRNSISSTFNGFIAKYDFNGIWLWTEIIQGGAVYAMKTDADFIYASGNSESSDTIIFANDTLTGYASLYRLFYLAKYTLPGNFIGVKSFFSGALGGFCCENPSDFVIDNSNNSVYIAGNFSFSAIFDTITVMTNDPGWYGYDFFLAKLQNTFTGIDEVISTKKENGISIFPNPTTGSIQLIINTKHNIPLNCEIINIMGEKVFQSQTLNPESPINLNLSFLPIGIYVIELTTDKDVFKKKLVVQ